MAAGGGEQASPVGVESVRALLTDLRASISQDIMKETLFVGFIHCALACFIVHEKHEADPQREPPLSDYFQPGKGFNPFSVRTAYERYVPMGALLAELSFAEPPIGRLPSSHVEASALLQIDPRNRVEVWRKAVESNPSAKVITSKCLAGGVERNPWAKQHKDCHIDDEELDQFVRFLMFSEAFQQLSPQARDELGITSTRLSCYDRGCNQFEVALRLRVQELLENQEREEAFFLVIFVTVFSSYEYLKGKFLKNLVGNEKDPAPFFWPRREHWPQIEEHLLLMVKVEDATEGSVVLTEWFGMSPAYYGFGQAVDAERRHLLEALLAGKNSFNTALERTTAHGLFGDAKILAMEDLMDVETGQGVQDFLEWLTTPNSHQRLGKKPKPLGWGALWGNVVTARLVNTGLFPECDFVPALSSGSEKTLKAIFPRATGKGVRLVYPTLAVQAATRLRDLGWEGLGFLPAEVKKLPMSVLEHALCKAQSKGPTVGAAPHSWQDCLKSAFPEETELALVSSLLERTEPMDIAPSLAQECVQAFWDVVKADQAIEGAIGVVGKRCIELMERKCNMAKLLHLGVNTLNNAEGKTFWASLQECADFTDGLPKWIRGMILSSDRTRRNYLRLGVFVSEWPPEFVTRLATVCCDIARPNGRRIGVRGLVGFLKGDLTGWTSSEGQEELVKQISSHRTVWVAYDEGNRLLFEEDGADGSVVAAHQDPAEGGHAERFLQDVDLAELPTLPNDGARVSTEDGAPQDHGDGEPSVGADVEEDDEMPGLCTRRASRPTRSASLDATLDATLGNPGEGRAGAGGPAHGNRVRRARSTSRALGTIEPPEWIPPVVKNLLKDPTEYLDTLKVNNIKGWTPPYHDEFPGKVYEDKIVSTNPLFLVIDPKPDEVYYIYSAHRLLLEGWGYPKLPYLVVAVLPAPGSNRYFHNESSWEAFGKVMETLAPKLREEGNRNIMVDICNRRFSTHDLDKRCYATRAARLSVPALGKWFMETFTFPSETPPREWIHEENVLGQVFAKPGNFGDLWKASQWKVSNEAGLPCEPTLGDLILATAPKRKSLFLLAFNSTLTWRHTHTHIKGEAHSIQQQGIGAKHTGLNRDCCTMMWQALQSLLARVEDKY
ncbi:hypothetical protein CYMTET_4509 [Cymbomonas tetramitiformis]|uniref:Uncharacterized protein n=1 Tax=Cymbomonas tetramitiformis TaxID=36881 RepID=A0AAE0LJZ5_9CHLO|nr:hypothetical protein CYMTET_4509 [Cymbomonas tetramitiformis]